MARTKVAPVSAASSAPAAVATVETKPVATKARAVNPLDFSYVKSELRRILIFVVGMITLLVVLSIVLR